MRPGDKEPVIKACTNVSGLVESKKGFTNLAIAELRRGARAQIIPLVIQDDRTQVVLVRGDNEDIRDLSDPMARPPDPLDEPGDFAGGVVLQHEVRGPDVDAELEGGRADQSLQHARLEVVLHLDPDFLREGPMVDAEAHIREPCPHPRGEEFRGVPRVDEEQRGVVGVDHLFAPPDRCGLDLLEVELLRDLLVVHRGHGELDVNPHPLRDRDLDHLDLPPNPAEECRDLLG